MVIKKNTLIYGLIIILYLLFVYRYKLFDKSYLFLVGDLYFSFNPAYDLKHYIGYHENNSFIINNENIKYIFWVLYRYINYLLFDLLKIPLFILNRLFLLVPAFLYIWSFFLLMKNYFNEKNNVLILFITLFLFTTGNLLQVIDPIGIWLPMSAVYFTYLYFTKDIMNLKYNNVIIISLLTIVIIAQPRYIIFLIYFLPVYSFFFLKKSDFFFIIKYFFILLLLSLLFNSYSIYVFVQSFLSGLSDNYLINNSIINLQESRLDHISSYNLYNVNIILLLSFFLNTYNPQSFIVNNNYIFILFIIIFTLNYFFSILDLFKEKISSFKKIKLKIFIIFLIVILFFSEPSLQKIYIKIPFLWTISSPVHIYLLFLPFISYVFINGIVVISNSLKKNNLLCKLYYVVFFFSCLIYIIPFLFSQSSFINRKFYHNANDNSIFAANNSFELGWIKIPEEYFNFELNIEKKKYKILHFPLVENVYVSYNFTDLTIPVIFTLYQHLPVTISNNVFFSEIDKKNFYLWESDKIVRFLKSRNYKYIIVDFNFRLNKYDDIYTNYSNFFYLIEKKSLKKIFSSVSFDIYELL
jgi:hypothetical protein